MDAIPDSDVGKEVLNANGEKIGLVVDGIKFTDSNY